MADPELPTEREVMWVRCDAPGVDHVRLVVDGGGVQADGLIIGVVRDRSFRFRHETRCDDQWRVREVSLAVLDSGRSELRLLADGEGRWTADGAAAPGLDGCVDVDLSWTAFTNTLPIRRLGWRPGQVAELLVAYVHVPELRLLAARQRYTCLEIGPEGGRYRYESVSSGFTAELPVDGDGLVVDYPGLFRRVWSR